MSDLGSLPDLDTPKREVRLAPINGHRKRDAQGTNEIS